MNVFYLTDEDLAFVVHNTNEQQISDLREYWFPVVELRVITEQEFAEWNPNDVVYTFNIHDMVDFLEEELGHPEDCTNEEDPQEQHLDLVSKLLIAAFLIVIAAMALPFVSGIVGFVFKWYKTALVM